MNSLTQAAARAPFPVAIRELPAGRLPDYIELAAYFIVTDALASIAKRAFARHASVAVTKSVGRLTVEVKDDGDASGARGARLRRLTDRLAAIEGRLEIESSRCGTTVRASIPCQ